MRRLFTVIGGTLVLLALIDVAVGRYLAWESVAETASTLRANAFQRLALLQFAELVTDARGATVRAYERWRRLPEEKAPGETRVFLISDSAGLFAAQPRSIEADLRAALHRHDVSVTPLMIPGAHAVDEERLVRAALAKRADVVVTLIALTALAPGPSFGTDLIEDLFDLPRTAPGAAPFEDGVERFLLRHWRLYRARGLLRAAASRLVARAVGTADRETARVEAAFTAIQAAATARDLPAVVRAYHEHAFPGLPGRYEPPPLAPDVVTAFEGSADEVTRAGATGVAVFLPVNPTFRNPAAPEIDGNRVDDAAVKERVAAVLGLFHARGWQVVDETDTLPPEDFVDLVHVNGSGTARLTDELVAIIVDAIAAR